MENLQNYKVAVDAMKGARDECETVATYLESLIQSNEISPEAAAIAEPQYREIIKDELNHALRFIFNIFVPLTGIEPDTDGINEEEIE